MKNLLFILIFITTVINASVIINVSYENKATYPYYLGNNNIVDDKNPGLAIDALRSIEKKLDIKFNFKREPGIRGQNKLKKNKIDLLLFASYKKKEKRWVCTQL